MVNISGFVGSTEVGSQLHYAEVFSAYVNESACLRVNVNTGIFIFHNLK